MHRHRFVLTAATLAVVAYGACGACDALDAQQVYSRAASSVVRLETYDAKGTRIGSGSATRVGERVYASNCHVLEDASSIQVSIDSTNIDAKIVGQDRQRNICWVEAAAGPQLLIQTLLPAPGSRVFAIANTAGIGIGISDGIVAGVRQFGGVHYLQFTAPISPGASGGALVDESGRLVGIIDGSNRYGQNVNFAVAAAAISDGPPRVSEEASQLQRSRRAREMLLQARWPELESLALAWSASEPDSQDAWRWLARSATQLRHFDAAINAWRALIQMQPNSVDFNVGLGEIYLARQMTAEALALAQGLAVDHDDDGRVHLLLARSLHALGRYKDAAGEYRRAIALDPVSIDAYQGLATVAQTLGDAATAIEIWRRLAGLYPDSAGPLIGLMQSYLAANKPSLAFAALEQLPAQDRNGARGWYWRGLVLARLDCPDQAVAAFRKSIELGLPEQDWGFAGIGWAMAAMSRTPEAIDAFRSAILSNPDRLEWRYDLAIQLRQGGRSGEALDITEVLIKRDPAVAAYWRQHGFVLSVLGRSAEAIPAMEHSLQIDPKQPQLWVALIESYQSTGRRKEALDAHRRLKEVDSDQADAAYRSYILPFDGERR